MNPQLKWKSLPGGTFALYEAGAPLFEAAAAARTTDGLYIDTRQAEPDTLRVEGRTQTLRWHAENGLVLTETLSFTADGLPTAQCTLSRQDGAAAETNLLLPLLLSASAGKLDGLWNDLWARMLLAPYDNTMWVRWEMAPLRPGRRSYDLTVLFSAAEKEGLLFGSLDFDTWKTAVVCAGSDARRLEVRCGAADEGTHDVLPHGAVCGTAVSSARICILHGADWRTLLERYGDCLKAERPPLPWKGGVPFGWNSWAAHALDLDSGKAEAAAAFVGAHLQPAGYGGAGGVSINLDAGWDHLSEAQLTAFAAHRHAVGQRAGIYDAPFAFFGSDAAAPVPALPGHTYAELLLRGPDGAPLPPVDGGRAYDVTSPLWREMTAAKLRRFVIWGFDYVKLDFLSHGGLEGCHADPAVATGRQAIAQGYRFVREQLSPQKAGRPIFLSLSIAPLFPAGFGHARRSSCDSFGLAADVEYTLNAQTYAWWQSGRLYAYSDPDHISLYRSFPRPRASTFGEARARYTSAVIAGTVMMLSEDFTEPEAARRAQTLACCPAVNRIAAAGTAFRPEHCAGASAAQIYRAEINGTAYIALFRWDAGKGEIAYALPHGCSRRWRELWTGAEVKCTDGMLRWTADGCDAALFQELPR